MSFKYVFSYQSLVHAVAGATGSSIAITAFYPLDTARTRLQVDDNRTARYSPEVIYEIFKEEGLCGLYCGWLPVVTSVCCSNFVYFYVFHGLKVLTFKQNGHASPGKDLLLGFVAGVTNVIITTPLWVANTRLKLQGVKWKTKKNKSKHPHYDGLFHCLLTIMRTEGLEALWSGMAPSLILTANPAVHFMVYEALKRRLQTLLNGKSLRGRAYFVIGALAKLVATFVTYPLQLAQARLRASRNGNNTHCMLEVFKQLIRANGFRGLYKGLEAKLTQTLLMAALMFLTYEKVVLFVFHLMRTHRANAKSL